MNPSLAASGRVHLNWDSAYCTGPFFLDTTSLAYVRVRGPRKTPKFSLRVSSPEVFTAKSGHPESVIISTCATAVPRQPLQESKKALSRNGKFERGPVHVSKVMRHRSGRHAGSHPRPARRTPRCATALLRRRYATCHPILGLSAGCGRYAECARPGRRAVPCPRRRHPGRRPSGAGPASRERRSVLDRLTRALGEILQHRMSGVAEQDRAAGQPVVQAARGRTSAAAGTLIRSHRRRPPDRHRPGFQHAPLRGRRTLAHCSLTICVLFAEMPEASGRVLLIVCCGPCEEDINVA